MPTLRKGAEIPNLDTLAGGDGLGDLAQHQSGDILYFGMSPGREPGMDVIKKVGGFMTTVQSHLGNNP